MLGALTVLNVVRHLVPKASPWVSATGTLLILVHARRRGLTWSQLGMGRHRVGSGARWGLGTIGAVGAVYLVGVLLPRTRPAFLDARHDVSVPEALTTAFVGIPVGTVLLEEVAFRSVLPGLLAQDVDVRGAHLISSALFGVWHVLPSLDFAATRLGAPEEGVADPTAADQPAGAGTTAQAHATGRLPVVLGTVAFTAAGGVVAAELRRRSDSVLASAGMHWATNALGVLFGIVARRLG